MADADRIFHALADPTRRAVLERLMSRGEAPVKELTSAFSVSQPAISPQLATLERAGLVSSHRDGRHAYCRVAPGGLRPPVSWMARYRAFWREKLPRLEAPLEEMDG